MYILNHHADIGALKHDSPRLLHLRIFILNHHADIGALKHRT